MQLKTQLTIGKFYLIDRDFLVYSDRMPLENLRTKARIDEKLGDLVHYLSQFNFKIIYKPGKSNVLADLLSRNPVLDYFEDNEIVKTVNIADFTEVSEDQKKMTRELKSKKNK